MSEYKNCNEKSCSEIDYRLLLIGIGNKPNSR